MTKWAIINKHTSKINKYINKYISKINKYISKINSDRHVIIKQ